MSAAQENRSLVTQALVDAVHALPAAFAIPLGEILRTFATADKVIAAGPPNPPANHARAIQYAAHHGRGVLDGAFSDYRDSLDRLDGATLLRAVLAAITPQEAKR